MASLQELKREYTKAINNGKAAIFAGAGLSCASGFVNWKELMRDLASDIRLDVDKEDDLVSVAQFYFNEKAGRGQINQKLMDCFTSFANSNENIEILSRLPINTYWTTNYDKIIEEGLKLAGKTVDIKYDTENFSVEVPNSDVTLYKMHGDISYPSKAILTKDDYESYNQTRQVFTTALQGDLVKKTFLFIGCSMTDPNMKYILSRIRLILKNNQRTHYCLLKKIEKKEYFKHEEYEYAVNKRLLEIRDLQRYGIDVVEYNKHSDITTILKQIEGCYQLSNIYLSGSASDYGMLWGDSAQTFLKKFTEMCFLNGYKITTGYGNGVGSFVISSILEKVLDSHDIIDKYLCLRPFPYDDRKRLDYKELKYNYRVSMIKPTGVGVFVFGNKEIGGEIVLADGVYEEYKICKLLNKLIIPIGSTGYVAAKILNEITQEIESYSYLEPYISILQKETKIETIIETVKKIISNYYKNIIDFEV